MQLSQGTPTMEGTGFHTSKRLQEQRWAEMERSFHQTVAERTNTAREAEVENTSSTLPRHPGSLTASMAELFQSPQGDQWYRHRQRHTQQYRGHKQYSSSTPSTHQDQLRGKPGKAATCFNQITA